MDTNASLSRRRLIRNATALVGVSGLTWLNGSPLFATTANAADGDLLAQTNLRGTYNATNEGLVPGAGDDQSQRLQSILNNASASNRPVFLPPGRYKISNIKLPANTRLIGVPGATKIVYTGAGHCFMAESGDHIELSGLSFDGANQPIGKYAEALLRLSQCRHLVVEKCEIAGSSAIGLMVDRSSGSIQNNQISGAFGECGLLSLENSNMNISHNRVYDCANGGILVHRWNPGEDGSIVANNQIWRISARSGGTGQWGNGINVYKAHSVQINSNQTADCEFSGIRSNGGSNVQILGNNCRRSGETAIYSEFEFEGAIITSNIVDGCARGISIVNFLQGGRIGVCANNIVRNCNLPISYEPGAKGGGISVEAETTVTGNVVENSPDFGILLGYGPYLRNVIAANNVVRGSKISVYVSVVEGCKSTTIKNNIFANFTQGAIVGFRWEEAVTGDLATNSAAGYKFLNISGNQLQRA